MLKNNRNFKWFILMGLVLAFLLRLGYVLTVQSNVYWVDEEDYMSLGQSLAQGRGFVNSDGEPTAFRPPGYPLLLAALYTVGIDSAAEIRLVHVVLSVVTVFFIGLMALRFMGPAVAVLSVVAAAGYPYFIYMTGTVLASTWFSMTLVMSVYLLSTGVEEKRSCKIIASGLLMGLSILTRSSAAVLGAAAVAWLIIHQPRREFLRSAFLFVFCMSLVAAPWGWRNYRVFGAFTMSTNGGRNLWLGNNPESTINTGSNINMSKDFEDRVDAASEIEADRIYAAEAKKHIVADPKHFLSLAIKKGISFWRFDPSPTTQGYSLLQKLYPVVSVASYAPIFFFGILGFILAKREQRSVMLLWIFFGIAFTLLHAVFITKVRFRLPLDHFMIIMAASGMHALWRQVVLFKRKWQNRLQTGMEHEDARSSHNFAFTRQL